MKRIDLETLRSSSHWHDIVRAGSVDGTGLFVDVPDEVAVKFPLLQFESIQDIPKSSHENFFPVKNQIHKAAISKGIPFDKWPLRFKLLSKLATEADSGIGDVIERSIGPIGGGWFKSWYRKATGKECGCAARKETLNARFPLQPSVAFRA